MPRNEITSEICINPNRAEAGDRSAWDLSASMKELPMQSIVYGNANYPLKGQMTLRTYYRSPLSPRFCCSSDRFDRYFIGHGDTSYEARDNWAEQFHQNFQKLLLQDSKEYSQEENSLWELFSQLIDIDAYWSQKIFFRKVIGRIIDPRPRHTKVLWLDGISESFPDPRKLPDNITALKSGMYFEAIVKKTFRGKTLRILSCNYIPNWQTEAKALDILEDSFPSSNDLPVKSLRTTIISET